MMRLSGLGVLAMAAVAPLNAETSQWSFSHHNGVVVNATNFAGRELTWNDEQLLTYQHGGETYIFLPETISDISTINAVRIGDIESVPPMARRMAFPTLLPPADQVPRSIRTLFNEKAVYSRAAPYEAGDRFLAFQLQKNQERITSLNIPGVRTSPLMKFRVELAGLNTLGYSPDHIAELSLVGGDQIIRHPWGGFTSTIVTWTEGEEPGGGEERLLMNRSSSLAIKHRVPNDTTFSVDRQGLRSMEVEWIGTSSWPSLGSMPLEVLPSPSSQPQWVTVGDMPSELTEEDLLLLDVSDPQAPVVLETPSLQPQFGGGQFLSFESDQDGGSYFLQLLAEAPALESTSVVEPLPTGGTDVRGAYVRPESLASTLAPLMLHRGPSFIDFDPVQAFVTYNNGFTSREAIREAIRDYASASHDQTFSLCLVGHATFDPKNNLGLSLDRPEVPTWVEESVTISPQGNIENPIDAPYGYLTDSDETPGIAIGRLPARSPEELSVMVNRIITVDNESELLRQRERPLMIVNDDDPQILANEGLWRSMLASVSGPVSSVILDVSSDGSQERTIILSGLAADPSPFLVLYDGHGNAGFWADERLLQTSDLGTFTATNHSAIMATFTCLNGYYTWPGTTSHTLAEAWLLEPGGGLAAISTCSVDYYQNQFRFERVMLEELLTIDEKSASPTIGEWLLRSQRTFMEEHPDLGITMRGVLLFGDPNSPILLPERQETGVEQVWKRWR